MFLQGLHHKTFQCPHRNLKCLVPFHFYEMHPFPDCFLRGRSSRSPARCMEKVPHTAVRVYFHRENSPVSFSSIQDYRTRTVTKEHAGGPVLPVGKPGKHLSTH